MEPLEQTTVPWAQGVGRSNRPAPTKFFKGLGPILLAAANAAVDNFVAATSSMTAPSNLSIYRRFALRPVTVTFSRFSARDIA
jgi:hypothetical protein